MREEPQDTPDREASVNAMLLFGYLSQSECTISQETSLCFGEPNGPYRITTIFIFILYLTISPAHNQRL